MFARNISRVYAQSLHSSSVARARLAQRAIARTTVRAFTSSLDDIAHDQFNDAAMKAAVSPEVYSSFRASITGDEEMTATTKQAIADAMMDFAIARDADKFAHIFYPVRAGGNGITGAAGMKHDSMIDLEFGTGAPIEPIIKKLAWKRLFTQETDGSSFPNGGLRQTHTAAAFTSWDKSSPPWVADGTLYIPSVFVSHNGDALDEKTPLLRAADAINREAKRLLAHGNYESDSTQVTCSVGAEQEFFLVDRESFVERPDLVACGRTILGAAPPRGQQTDLNYFGTINPRAHACMTDFTDRCWRLGISNVVMHNEVAPGQHEFSPIFSLCNSAADQNVLTLDTLMATAADHGLTALFHEKPFANLNGSGKHNNFSLFTSGGKCLYEPGDTPEAQEAFMTQIAAVAYAIHNHGDVIRTAVASYSNDFRLGAQEAPPAIMSLCTGALMEEHIKDIVAGGPLAGYGENKTMLDCGASSVEQIPTGVEDRNRTAPFPFCGNRFEFRAVGSTQNIAFPMSYVMTAISSGMSEISSKIEGGMTQRDAVAAVFEAAMPAIFNGNGYSAEWNGPGGEAEGRGLLNLVSTVDAVDTLVSDKNEELFSSMNVLSPGELAARQEIMYESYTNTATIEAATMIRMLDQGVLPACAKDLATYAAAPSLAGDRAETYEALAAATSGLKEATAAVPEEPAEAARYCADVLRPQMMSVRDIADAAEEKIDGQVYPFPSYHDMMYNLQSEPAASSRED